MVYLGSLEISVEDLIFSPTMLQTRGEIYTPSSMPPPLICVIDGTPHDRAGTPEVILRYRRSTYSTVCMVLLKFIAHILSYHIKIDITIYLVYGATLYMSAMIKSDGMRDHGMRHRT